MLSRRIASLLAAAAAPLAPVTPAAAQTAAPPVIQPDPASPAVPGPAPDGWSALASDLPADPAFRVGRLANGLRYIVRTNDRPEGTAMVRMVVDTGSLDEHDDERGFAHFVEHMAFNGSTNVPEGEMVRLLEREGLAFGADTNASTGYGQTTYQLDLPRGDPKLLDTALMLMRETASELDFDPEAVARERGVILSERRDRNTYALRDFEDGAQFLTPDARYTRRLPIGTLETVNAATADTLRAFWRRGYVPGNTTLVVVGDFPPDAMEAAIRTRFADWATGPVPADPPAGPIAGGDGGRTDLFVDPALSERVTITAKGAALDEEDSLAARERTMVRAIGYGIVNRRFQSLARAAGAPLRGAGYGTAELFDAARATNLVIDSGDGEWPGALAAGVAAWRQALEYGFAPAEVAEQVANLRAALEAGAASAATRSNGALTRAALALATDRVVPTTPASTLARFERLAPTITPDAVLAAMRAHAVALDDPLIRFEGRQTPAGGAPALRAAWDAAVARPVEAAASGVGGAFAYTDFGPTGTVVSDIAGPLGIREIRFANGLMLNLKPTDLTRDRIVAELAVDGGELLNTPADPLKTALVSGLPVGGLGAHSQDQLQSILSGHTVGLGIRPGDDAFELGATTTPADLLLQLQLFAAAISDPGYRPEGEDQFRRNIADFFASKDATPGSALGNAIGGILSGGDPRFTLQPEAAYQALTFAGLRGDIGDRLAHGAMELALVGDFDPDTAIAAVARTLGALPPREPAFRPYAQERARAFTADRSRRIVTHGGAPDQAIVTLVWPTRDDRAVVPDIELAMLERVMQIELTETLREKLGKAYSPRVSSDTSSVHSGYGTFSVAASVDLADLDAARAAILETAARMRAEPITADELARARAPLVERFANFFKTNGGWMALADRAQSESYRIEEFSRYLPAAQAVDAAAIRRTARTYLAPDQAVEIDVVPRGSAAAGAGPGTDAGAGAAP